MATTLGRNAVATLLAILFLLGLGMTPAMAEDDEGYSKNDYPETLSGPRLFHYTSFRFNVGTLFISGQTQDVQIIELSPGATVGILPELSLDFDIEMDIITGDKSGFTFASFGTGVNYTFYNVRPVILTTGIHFRLINQSLENVAGADVFYMRPYLASGIEAWRFYFSPYLGVPIYIDTNNDNDQTLFAKRKPDYFLDDDPFGLDYGIPISFLVYGGFYLTVEPSAVTWFQPDLETYIYVTPGVFYRMGMFQAGLGVRIRVYPDTDNNLGEERWAIVINAGVSF